MATWKAKLLGELLKLEGVEVRPSKVAGGSALFYQGKEFAHFHSDRELDLRLTKARIKELGLVHPTDSFQHPSRAKGSHWIEVRFQSAQDIAKVVTLVQIAVMDR